MYKVIIGATIGVSLAALISAGPVHAQAVELKLASPSPPKAHLNRLVFTPWVKEVTESSGGTINMKLVAGRILASHRNLYDRVKSNVAQAGWSLQSFVPGKFPRTSVVDLPLIYSRSEVASKALWALHKQGLLGNEYDEVKPLAIFALPPNSLHATKPINTIESFKGIKVGTSGAMRNKIVHAIGATPVSVLPPQLYQGMSRSLIGGILVGFTAFQPYRLGEVTSHHFEGPLGGQAGMVIMNKQAYEGLSAKGRQTIEDNSQAKLVERYSKFWDRVLASGREKVLSSGKNTTHVMTEAQGKRLQKMLQPVIDEWVEKTPDGAKILAAFRSEVAKARAEMK